MYTASEFPTFTYYDLHIYPHNSFHQPNHMYILALCTPVQYTYHFYHTCFYAHWCWCRSHTHKQAVSTNTFTTGHTPFSSTCIHQTRFCHWLYHRYIGQPRTLHHPPSQCCSSFVNAYCVRHHRILYSRRWFRTSPQCHTIFLHTSHILYSWPHISSYKPCIYQHLHVTRSSLCLHPWYTQPHTTLAPQTSSHMTSHSLNLHRYDKLPVAFLPLSLPLLKLSLMTCLDTTLLNPALLHMPAQLS